ncbi:MAG: lipoate--protein ligase family protein [Rhodanobacteraceae bacterium]
MSTAAAMAPRAGAALSRVRVDHGLALERELVAAVSAGPAAGAVRIWRPADRTVVVPSRFARRPGFAQVCAVLARHGYPVVLRESGGDIVPQLAGVLNVAVAFAIPRRRFGVEAAYGVLCGPLVRWLRGQGLDAGVGAVPGSFCDGRFNVTVAGRKLAGTAQRWCSAGLDTPVALAHAVVLVNVDLAELAGVCNAFYGAAGISRACVAGNHTTLDGALLRAGYPLLGVQSIAQRLLERYHERFATLDSEAAAE